MLVYELKPILETHSAADFSIILFYFCVQPFI